MKIQSLAIMFIILILPISLVLSSYTRGRVQTISLQAEYDSKLNDATYDALKAYQLNSLNSDTSDYTNSKMRDIKASVNTFFNSISTNLSTAGYSKTTIQNYVPAIVYTMYDGYYIYSPYVNTWDEETEAKFPEGAYHKYNKDEKLYGLKPYVYYSCRYKKGNTDVVITYTLDNYIEIQGTVDGNPVSKYGYVLNNVVDNGNNTVTYEYANGKTVTIEPEVNQLRENIQINGEDNYSLVPCLKRNGTKYYTSNANTVFSVLSGKSIKQSDVSASEINNNTNAVEYYKEAAELKNFIENSSLKDLSTNDIVDLDGNKYAEGKSPYYSIGKIFDFGNIESDSSNFNAHRIDVIKNSIIRNLSVAISNFNNYSNVTTDFQMPELKDTDWDKIMDNISIISFLQGLNIGGKVYNGYSIITNTKNEDVVMNSSIYIQTRTSNGTLTFHRVTETGLNEQKNLLGVFNVNLERKTAQNQSGTTVYYYPIFGTLSYDSIVTQNNIAKESDQELSEYLSDKPYLAKVYYTALGRERYGLYRQKLIINEGDYPNSN